MERGCSLRTKSEATLRTCGAGFSSQGSELGEAEKAAVGARVGLGAIGSGRSCGLVLGHIEIKGPR